MTPPPPLSSALRGLPMIGKLTLAALGLATAALTLQLWPHWRTNPDLSHGYFMPLLFLLLLKESRSGTPRQVAPGLAGGLVLAALLTSALLALVAAGLYSASVGWSHALVSLSLVVAFTLFVGAAALVFAREPGHLVSCNWQLIVAAALWWLTTPLPPGTYTRLTLTLQLWVSEGVLQTLHLLGIAAIRQGNIIDLAATSVGVEEACSGVRSLISCVFAGMFFSATLVRRPWARALIIALAAPLALGMNFIRSLGLTLLANRQVDITGAWHDFTGFAVLGLTALALGSLAIALDRGGAAARTAPAAPVLPLRGHRAQWALGGSLVAAALMVGALAWNNRPLTKTSAPVPNLAALLPDAPTGWQMSNSDLFEFRGTLRTEYLAQRNYRCPASHGRPPTELVLYVAYWRAGQAPVSLVAAHTPDACWPGAGWSVQPNTHPRVALTSADRPLPTAEYRIFDLRGLPYHVWYWHVHDGQPIAYRDPYSALELLRIAWRFGFRRDGDQVFIRVSSNRPWEEIQDEALLRDFFARVRPLGV